MDGNIKNNVGRKQVQRVTSCLKEQFNNGLNYNSMMLDIVLRLTLIIEMNPVTKEQVWAWTRKVEAQGAQTAMLGSLKENKELMQ